MAQKITITVEKLEHLLSQQRHNCVQFLWKSWEHSEFKNECVKAGINADKFYEIRDKVYNSPIPEDLKILKSYLEECD